MSQRNVEQVIGRLITDEGFRQRFLSDRRTCLRELAAGGLELNPCEIQGLLGLEAEPVRALAEALDPRLQKIDPTGENA